MILRLRSTCPWPERRGKLAQIVEAPEGYNVYPFAGLSKDWVVVFLPEDAPTLTIERRHGEPRLIGTVPHKLDGYGIWWTCVVRRSDLIEVPGGEDCHGGGEALLCGAKDGGLAHLGDEHRGCVLSRGHESRFHQEWKAGELLAEWSGPRETP